MHYCMASSVRINLDNNPTLSEICSVAYGAKVTLAPAAKKRLAARRGDISDYVKESEAPAYGFNRGFGHNVHTAVPAHLHGELQKNLVRSHASGVGPAAPTEVVRATMFLRALSLAQGFSGVRPQVVQSLCSFLNSELTPQVPQFGSVGASGDLAPLAHIALALIGEGPFTNAKGRTYLNLSQLRGTKPKALQLQMKEGLALVNGVQFSTAYALLALQQCKLLLNQAIINSALVTQVMLGSDAPFAADYQSLRPHPGALAVAKKLRALMAQSPIRDFHRDYSVDGLVQDPYNIRCTPQILGACHELLTTCEETLLIEASSVTDNPLILGQRLKGKTRYTQIVSGGHFHGMPVAVQLYHLLEMMSIVARLSNMRCVRFVDESKNMGLGSGLKWTGLSDDESAGSSGMMIPEYVSAALCNHIWGQAMPTHLFSLSTDAGQEDHVSMSAGLAVRVWDTLPRLAEVLAIEFAYCLQAVAIRHHSKYFPSKNGNLPWPKQSRRLSRVSEQIVKEAWTSFPPVTKDRPLSNGIKKLAQEIAEGRYAQLAHKQL